MAENETLLKTSDAAKLLGVTAWTVRQWDKAGKIKSYRTIGNARRIPLSEVERIMNRMK